MLKNENMPVLLVRYRCQAFCSPAFVHLFLKLALEEDEALPGIAEDLFLLVSGDYFVIGQWK